MNTAVNELVRSVIDKNSLDECSVDELQQMVQQYPYFGPAQFLLARKLKEEASSLYDKQSQRSLLYFQDHLWFDYLTGEGISAGTLKTVEPETSLPEETVAASEMPVVSSEDNPGYDPVLTQTSFPEEAIAETQPAAEEPSVINKMTETVSPDVSEEEPVISETVFPGESITESTITEQPISEESVGEEEPSAASEMLQVSSPGITGEEPVISETGFPERAIAGTIIIEDLVDEPATIPREPAAINEVSASSFHEEKQEEIIPPLGPVELVPAVEEQPASETKTDAESEPLSFKITPLDTTIAAPLAFEPYHTVDYFASQGIRFREEEKPKDRFGQQLKSFTEWLKSMKRLPEVETAATNQPDDKKVTQLAEHSIVNRDVVTEAMADVWEKQGNKEKALEIYNKLSLLNPAKSSYFAAKIDHLKNL